MVRLRLYLRLLSILPWTTLLAQSRPDPAQVLVQARDRVRNTLRRLPKYTCVQTVDRTYFEPRRQRFPTPSCDSIIGSGEMSRSDARMVATDRIRLDVAVAAGHEIHSWAGASRFDSRRVDEIVERGPIGTGPFGTFLNDIFENEGTEFLHAGDERNLFIYRYRVPREASHYMVGDDGDWSVTGFDGTFEVNPQTFDLQRLTVRTGELPSDTGMCQATTSLDYQQLRIGAGRFLLPRENRLRILYTSACETESRTTYSACREYRGESQVRFDGFEAEAAGSVPAVSHSGAAVEAGISIDVRMLTAIDTDVAAAGDRVLARVASPGVNSRTGRVTVAEGSILQGRITRMEHRLKPSPHFLIVIQFESLEQNGAATPLTATLDRTSRTLSRGERIQMPAAGHNRGALIFPTSKSRYVVPVGYATRWRTVDASVTAR